MADFATCIAFVLRNEDSTLSYAKNQDACPEGCVGPCWAIAGINSGEFPAEFLAIAAIPQSDRGPAIQHFYQTEFWNQWYTQLESDGVAMRVLDEAVNAGPQTAVRILQAAINTLIAEPIAVDGGWGPNTITAANACDQSALQQALITVRMAHYRSIAAANPNDQKYLAGWLSRASK